jgi:hypothetical protein
LILGFSLPYLAIVKTGHMKIKRPYFLLGLIATAGTLALANFSTSDKHEDSDQLVHKGTSKYPTGNDQTAFPQVNVSKPSAYFTNVKYYVESTLTEITACAYPMVPVKTRLPDFPYSEKDTIASVKSSSVDLQNQIKAQSFTGAVEKSQ